MKFTTELRDEILTFKINSGEELIAKVLEVYDDYMMLGMPVSVAPGPQGMNLMPSFFTADRDESVRINTSAIAMVAQTDDGVKVKYIEAVSGISVPPKKKLILG